MTSYSLLGAKVEKQHNLHKTKSRPSAAWWLEKVPGPFPPGSPDEDKFDGMSSSHNKHVQLDQICKSKGRCSMGREGVGHAEKLSEYPADAICLLRKRLLTSREGERAELSRPGLEGLSGFQEPSCPQSDGPQDLR